MPLRDEIENYRQPDGLISPQKTPTADSTGNGLSYLSLYMHLLNRLRDLTISDVKSFLDTTNNCQLKQSTGDGRFVYISGIFNRSPTKIHDQNGFDDYVLMSWASSALARTIVNAGKSWFWTYNNVDFNKVTFQSCFGLRPQVVAHFYWCALDRPNIFWRFGWAMSIIFQSLFGLSDSTASVIAYAMVDASLLDTDPLVRYASKLFKQRFNKQWGSDSLKNALFGYIGKDHPIAIYWQ